MYRIRLKNVHTVSRVNRVLDGFNAIKTRWFSVAMKCHPVANHGA